MKKLLISITSIFILTVFANTLSGDINQDNIINASDALCVLKHSAKLTLIVDESLLVAADVNSDTLIDAVDALLILKYSAHLIESFPSENQEFAAAIPTEIPDFDSENVFDMKVKSLNDVAISNASELNFTSIQKHGDGVEMFNPFSAYEIKEGVSISFWFTPDSDIIDIYANTTILCFVNEQKSQIIKYDMEGSYQYADGISFINHWDPSYKFTGGVSYFMTCVISGNGLKYYVNGSPIPILHQSVISSSSGKEKILPLIMDSDTRLYIGGTNNIWWNEMAQLASHRLPVGTKIKDIKAYFKPLSYEEIQELYKKQN